MKKQWYRRRWLEFREGHGIYLIFLMTFINFVLITYRLLIERVPFLQGIFSELWIFVIVFLISYLPLAIILGHWHRKTQYTIEARVKHEQDPFIATLFRVLIDMQLGRASKEEVENLYKLLKSIEQGTPGKY